MQLKDKLGTNIWSQSFDPARFSFDEFKRRWDYDLSMAAKLPISWLRIGYTYYDAAVDSEGTHDFTRLDYAIKTAQQAGLKVILPVWFTTDGVHRSNVPYSLLVDEFKDMILQMVISESGKSIVYEAADEAFSGGHFWLEQNMSQSIYQDILSMNKQFFEWVNLYDDSATFISGDFASVTETTQRAAKDGALSYGRMSSIHLYETVPETLITSSSTLNFFKQMKNSGRTLSATEFGYGYPSAFNGANSRQEQSDKTLRQIFILDALGFDQIINFTCDSSDATWSMQASPDTGGWNQVGSDLINLVSQLDGFNFEKLLMSRSGDYDLIYRNGTIIKHVFWTINADHTVDGRVYTGTPQIDDGIDSYYRVYQGKGSDPLELVAEIAAPPFKPANLESGVSYRFAVSKVTNGRESKMSQSVIYKED